MFTQPQFLAIRGVLHFFYIYEPSYKFTYNSFWSFDFLMILSSERNTFPALFPEVNKAGEKKKTLREKKK